MGEESSTHGITRYAAYMHVLYVCTYVSMYALYLFVGFAMHVKDICISFVCTNECICVCMHICTYNVYRVCLPKCALSCVMDVCFKVKYFYTTMYINA